MKELRRQNVPVTGVGFQLHVAVDRFPTVAEMQTNFDRLTKLGLKIGITELDVRIPQKAKNDPAVIAKQARIYRDYAAFCVANTSCENIVTWGISDKHSWVEGYFGDQGSALLFDAGYHPKQAYWKFAEALR
ncbi:MAG: endo-1,4-beta-xylanase [Bdellovibrionota bacterium]